MTRRRAPEGIPILIALDPKAGESLSRQIYRSLRDGILAGRLAAGLRLPSTRALATDLGVSRNTVVTAFDQLLAEGYVDSRVGRGTRVTHTMPDHLLHARGRPRIRAVPAAPANAPSARGRLLVQHARPKSAIVDGVVPFAPGVPALDLFPWPTWSRLVSSRGRELGAHSAGYADSLGYPPLREAVARYVAVARGVTCTTGQVVIVGGSQQGLDLVARVLVDPGDVILVELPTYVGAISAFRNLQASLVGVPQEADGIDLAALDATWERVRREGRRVKILYVVPNFQNPTGLLIGRAKRQRLLEWAERRDVLIVEDDPYCELYLDRKSVV